MKRWQKILIGVIVGLLIVSVALFFGVNMYIDSMFNRMEQTETIKVEEANVAQSVQEQTKDRNVVNIAIFGTDHDADEGDSVSERADATKIISLDMDNKKIVITSLQRDTLVYLPGDVQDFDKFNHSYWYGGPELSLQTINMNFDLDITRYVSFSFESLEKIVDLVGGVDIYLTQAEINQDYKPIGVSGPEGVYHLNGEQALLYSRIRNIDNDYERMQRQNNVITAIIQAVKGKSVFDLIDLANNALPYVETNLTNGEIKDYLTSLVTFDLSDIKQYQIPENGSSDVSIRSYKGWSPLYLLDSYSEQAIQLHKNIYLNDNYQPSEQLLEVESKIYAAFN